MTKTESMGQAEDELEALLRTAELAQEVKDKLLSPEDRERLEAAGFEVTTDAWGDPVAKFPYEDGYVEAPLALRVLAAIGEETAGATVALWRMGFAEEAKALRQKALARYRAERRDGLVPAEAWTNPLAGRGGGRGPGRVKGKDEP